MGQSEMQHVFIIGAKSIGQYGGYETFIHKLICEHENEGSIKYHVACKANGEGCMDEAKLANVKALKKDNNGNVLEFEYKNTHVFKIHCPSIGPAVAIYYDRAVLLYAIAYCKKYNIEHPIFYILTCRIGIFINWLFKKIRAVGGKYYINPDGHEWRRLKWNPLIRCYWKWSEKKMVTKADLVICDSKNIEKYIKKAYSHPHMTYISYGADVNKSKLSDDDFSFKAWMKEKGLSKGQYYLIVGRFVPENNYETMIREFMKSNSSRNLAIVTNVNKKYQAELEKKLHWKKDKRIRFVGTVYDQDLLKKIRENAYAYIHGHEVGGTNPSLLEALASTKINLLLNVSFNREVGQNAALFWKKDEGKLCELIDKVDKYDKEKKDRFGYLAKKRISDSYNWSLIGEEYKNIWLKTVDCKEN